MNIFVAKLNYNTSELDIRQLFEQFGTVDSVKIITDRDTGRSKGFGFVEMPDDEEAYAAINALNETEVDDFNIAVKKAVPREERNNRRGGGGGYNRNRGGGGGGYRDRRGGGGGGGYRDRRDSGGDGGGGGGYRQRKRRDSWSDDRSSNKDW